MSTILQPSFLLPGGWNPDIAYRFNIIHIPDQGLIRLKLYEGSTLLHDSEDIFDNGPEGLKGGKLGVYCDSQEKVRWSALSYRYLVKYKVYNRKSAVNMILSDVLYSQLQLPQLLQHVLP